MKLGVAAGVLLCAALSFSAAASSPVGAIGFVKTTGDFTLDGAAIRDNATLFNGSVIETSLSPSHVVLEDGTRVDLGRNSRTRIYRGYLVLEKGTSQVVGNLQFPMTANTLRIASSEPFRVALLEHGSVSVTAVSGATQVRNAQGNLVAVVRGGSTLNFQDTGAPAATQLTGCLQKVRNHYVLRDTTTNIVVEIQGQDLERYLGKSVDVTGTTISGAPVIEGASELIRVTNIVRGNGKSCPPEIPFATAAGTGSSGAGAAGVGGFTPGAKAIILAGILISSTLIGLGLSGYLGGTAATSSAAPH